MTAWYLSLKSAGTSVLRLIQLFVFTTGQYTEGVIDYGSVGNHDSDLLEKSEVRDIVSQSNGLHYPLE